MLVGTKLGHLRRIGKAPAGPGPERAAAEAEFELRAEAGST
ncbi:MAG TPA: hypothetical protein VHA80_08710 [Solirubrobacterales bacterium]|nr:hypothetical protein [Solirubrobacterales bacterium]